MKFLHFSEKFAQLWGVFVVADKNYRVPASFSDPLTDYIEITPSDTPLEGGACRAIRCTEDGFLNLTTPAGIQRANVPVFKGDNPLAASVIDAPTSGLAPAIVLAGF